MRYNTQQTAARRAAARTKDFNGSRGICKAMQLALCPLFSGSSGNCVYLSLGGARLLVDAGVACSRIEASLRELGADLERIDAVLVTHDHVDHVRGLAVLCRRYGLPVYANEGTWNAILAHEANFPRRCMRTFLTGEEFSVGQVSVRPFPIPHDAAEPVGFVFSCGGLRCAVATDIGRVEDGWLSAVEGAQALVIEANHDVDMVRRGPYPQRLKRRILGANGHLCNEDCALALQQLAKKGAKAVFLSHLSADNNLPELAYNTVCEALARAGYEPGRDVRVMVSRRDRVSDLLLLSDEEA